MPTVQPLLPCPGRRDFLAAGGASLAWLTPLGTALARAAEKERRPAKSVVVLWLGGGPSQLETFDPKPGTNIAAGTKAIDTSAKGVQLAAGLEQLADQMRHVALVRSLWSKEGDHERGTYAVKTGYRPDPTVTHPSLGAIYDRLRDMRQLPEQRDFQNWKREQMKPFEPGTEAREELWHIPSGRSLKVAARPHLFGGIYMIFQEITAQLRLEASFKLLTQVQRATLDIIHEGTAIFGPDGRLLLHNATFTKLWRLTEDERASWTAYVEEPLQFRR